MIPTALVALAFASEPRGARPPAGFPAVTAAPDTVEPGDLYVAISATARCTWAFRDQQAHVDLAVARGAAGIVIEREDAVAPSHVARFLTADSVGGLRRLAAAWRQQRTLPVIAVAGSVGKTTTTDLAATMLARRWRVHRTTRNRNGAVGIALTVLGLRPEHEIAIIEIAIDAPGQMADHVAVVAPTIAIVTAIAPEHLDGLGDVATVAREECVVLDHVAQAGGLTVIPSEDDALARWYASRRPPRCVRYATTPTVAAELYGSVDLALRTMTVEGSGLPRQVLPLRLHGMHNARNLLGAVALARAAGVGGEHVLEGAALAAPVDGRSEVRHLWPGFVAIGDHFNANPGSMASGLALLASFQGRRWACLGDMVGMGDVNDEACHRALAPLILAHGIERVELLGPRMRWLARELAERGFAGALRHHADREAMARVLVTEVRKGDVILLKASHPMGLDDIWRLLPFAAARNQPGRAP